LKTKLLPPPNEPRKQSVILEKLNLLELAPSPIVSQTFQISFSIEKNLYVLQERNYTWIKAPKATPIVSSQIEEIFGDFYYIIFLKFSLSLQIQAFTSHRKSLKNYQTWS